jgi:serine/threonine-protein kinase
MNQPGRESARAAPPLPDRYEDLGPIARGGWGEVRRVRDRTMDRVVAMKVLAWEHLGSERVLARFLNEANVTAALEHPGVVPVHDRGVLADGRPWFTMKEVRGRTLHELVHEPRDAEADGGSRSPAERGDPRALRRLVDVFARVCETVGYAHERGIVHRDLKPGNVMVGQHGEVLVLDWGIARSGVEPFEPVREGIPIDPARTQPGDILGTVAYMSPEQARGANDQLGTASDVFSLGLVLYEILTGQRARPSESIPAWAQAASGIVPALAPPRAPEELAEAYARAVRTSRAAPLSNAMALAEATRAWLDGSARRERASRSVAAADTLAPRIEVMRRERDELRAQDSVALADVRDPDPVEKKLPAWRLEDEALAKERERALLEAERIELLRAALEHDAEYAPAHARLAEVHRSRVVDAEARGDRAEAALAEISLRRHDRGEHARFLEGRGRIELGSEPSGARVVASRYVERDRRLVPEPVGELGTTPLELDLPAGSYLLVLERDGHSPARLPVRIARDETWRNVRPGDASATPVRLAREGELDRDDVLVPAGWYECVGDDRAPEPIRARRVWIDSFVVRRHPVTCGEYLAFLDELRGSDAFRYAPRVPALKAGEAGDALAVDLGPDGRFRMRPDTWGRAIADDVPVAAIDWLAACAYADWLARRTSLPWRLPSELEWEKAARGADGRAFPWGAHPEPTWARALGSTLEPPARAPIDAYPIDESPYGVRGLAGNVQDWCLDVWALDGPTIRDGVLAIERPANEDPRARAIRGGTWGARIELARSAGRFAFSPSAGFASVGLRLARSLLR